GGAGIVDQDVDAAELVAHDARDGLDLVDPGHIERMRLDLLLCGLHDVARGLCERLLPAGADEHLPAFPRQRARRLQPDALAAAGDERRLARKPEVHRSNSCQVFLRLHCTESVRTSGLLFASAPVSSLPVSVVVWQTA